MVRLPDAAGQVRNAPVKALRALFAGVGELLLAADRFRVEEAEREQAGEAGHHDRLTSPAPGQEAPARDAQLPEQPRFRSLDSTGNVRVLAAGEGTGGAPSLPVPGYDDLSLPSLRARLRNLDAAQLRLLVEYEKANAGRPDVVMMFERRIAKLEAVAPDAP